MSRTRPEFIDTHAHMNLPEFRLDTVKALHRAEHAGVRRVVNIGTQIDSSRRAIALAEQHEGLFATVGVHPHDASSCDAETIAELRRLCEHPKVVAVGEVGLDFYRDLSPRPVQVEVFKRLIELAWETSLPIIVHDREADEEVLTILEAECPDDMGGVLHCYSAGPDLLERTLALGFHIGIDGPVTYTTAGALRKVAARAPLDRILLETDCPYLAPKGRDRNQNEPAFLPDIAAKIAEVRGLTPTEVAAATTANALRLFPRLSG
ncbi:MAG: TatD family deoxyribonuclease [Armatimonadetes bacterium]|nr:TatD family deoxyribonuclease [Armatimonadota bacterium]